jgi:hypothetical protein
MLRYLLTSWCWQWLKPIGLARMLQDPLQDISNYCRTKVPMLQAQPLAPTKTEFVVLQKAAQYAHSSRFLFGAGKYL